MIQIKNCALALLVCVMLFIGGCSSSSDPAPVDCNASDLSLNFTKTDLTSCNVNDGSINASATGGSGPYQYALDAGAYASSANFTALGAGTYQLKVKDSNGCERTKSVTVNAFGSTLSATVTTSETGCKATTGQITVAVAGGTGPFSYQVNGGASASTPSFTNLASGTYSVKVTDASGCSVTQSVKVTTTVKYSIDVKPIIETKCAISGCHVAGGSSPNFTQFANIQSSAAQIKTVTQNGSMPKNGSKLPQAELDLIACWVDDGALNN